MPAGLVAIIEGRTASALHARMGAGTPGAAHRNEHYMPPWLIVTCVWLGAFGSGLGLGWLICANRMAWHDVRETAWLSEN